MIKFKRLRFKNAVTFLDSENSTSIPLQGQGCVFLAGDNRDTGGSNGAGKSTIFEILQHLLFSTTSKGFARNKFAEDGFKAELELEVDGHDYRILQFRGLKGKERKSGYEIWKDGADVTPKGTRHMQDCIKLIKNIIGITEEEFKGYIYLAQEGASHVLISGKGAAKRSYLSNLFNLDRYDEVRQGVAEELENINARLVTLSSKAALQKELQEQIEMIPMSLDNFEGYAVSLNAAKEFIAKKHKIWSTKLREAEVLLARAEERENTKKQLDAIFPKWADIDVAEKLIGVQEKLRKLNKRVDQMRELTALLAEKEELECAFDSSLVESTADLKVSLSASQEEIAELKTQLKGIKKRNALRTKLPDISTINADVPSRLEEVEHTTNNCLFKLKETEETLASLADLTGAFCPTCGQSLDVRALATQRKELENAVGKIKTTLSEAEKSKTALSALAEKLQTYAQIKAQMKELPSGDILMAQSHMEKLTGIAEDLSNKVQQARDNEKIAKRLAKIAAAIAKYPENIDVSLLPEYKQKQEKGIRSVEKLQTLAKLKAQFEAMPSIKEVSLDKYKELKKKATHYEEAKEKLAAIYAEATAQRSSLITLHDRLDEVSSALEAEAEVRDRKKLFEAMKAAYGPKGLKVVQLKKICNAICDTLPKYTSIMFQEPRIEFFVDNDPEASEIEFYVRRFLKDGTLKEYPVGKLSGGEKKRLAVSMVFTLAELVAPRKRSNLIVLDEVGDGLDASGEYAFSTQLLPKLVQDTVIVTSHRPGIEAAQFNEHWTVVKENNCSSVMFGE